MTKISKQAIEILAKQVVKSIEEKDIASFKVSKKQELLILKVLNLQKINDDHWEIIRNASTIVDDLCEELKKAGIVIYNKKAKPIKNYYNLQKTIVDDITLMCEFGKKDLAALTTELTEKYSN